MDSETRLIQYGSAENEEDQFETTLQASGEVQENGRFVVDAITAGKGNDWEFSPECLRASLDLWNGSEVFVDHSGFFFRGRSVRDLGGVLSNPRWNNDINGIRCDLDAMGPSAELIETLGQEMLKDTGRNKPRIGFSADVIFTAAGRKVKRILRVMSVDLVFNPARGGAFVRALNSLNQGLSADYADWKTSGNGLSGLETYAAANGKESVFSNQIGGNKMSDSDNELVQAATVGAEGTNANNEVVGTQLQNRDVEAVRELLAVQREQARLAEEADEARKVRAQMCEYLLESGLSASGLPAPMVEYVRRQFVGQVFEPSDLTDAIEDARGLVSDLSGAGVVAGPSARISSMFSSEDQLQAAVDDLMDAPREAGMEGLKTNGLSGIKELYMMMTGDRDLYGGYYPSRITLATTADFTGLVANSLNKIVANQWKLLGAAGYDWWMRVTVQEHFTTLNQITGTLVGTVGTLPSISEGAEYTELAVGDSPETADFTKYGGYVPLTLELIDRDNTRKLRQYPKELAKAGIRRISALVSAVFTDNSGIGPTMADTGALFNATAVTTAGGHANLLTTALSSSEWEVVSSAVYAQPLLIKQATGYYGTGAAMAINPRYCIVPRELELTAKRILYPWWDANDNKHSENLQRGSDGDVVVVPEWTDANNWAAVCDPNLVPGIIVGERFGIRPEIFIAGNELSPAVFMNDEHRIKVRHFIAILVQDFRPLHKSNVA
jgi:hypothetical protein